MAANAPHRGAVWHDHRRNPRSYQEVAGPVINRDRIRGSLLMLRSTVTAARVEELGEINMPYLPADLFHFCSLQDAKGPAIFFAKDGREITYLKTGGAEPMVLMMDGDRVGHGIEARKWRGNGYAIEGIEFEVDPASQHRPGFVERPLGALILGPSGIRVTIAVKDGHGFDEALDFPMVETDGGRDDALDRGFVKWRAIIRRGEEKIEVLKFEATTKADR